MVVHSRRSHERAPCDGRNSTNVVYVGHDSVVESLPTTIGRFLHRRLQYYQISSVQWFLKRKVSTEMSNQNMRMWLLEEVCPSVDVGRLSVKASIISSERHNERHVRTDEVCVIFAESVVAHLTSQPTAVFVVKWCLRYVYACNYTKTCDIYVVWHLLEGHTCSLTASRHKYSATMHEPTLQAWQRHSFWLTVLIFAVKIAEWTDWITSQCDNSSVWFFSSTFRWHSWLTTVQLLPILLLRSRRHMPYTVKWLMDCRKALSRGRTDHFSLISFTRGRQQ